jgi:large subunit ribosomal protein L31e
MVEKRSYTVPLRRGFQKTERHQRAKKAVSVLRAFLKRHMKTDEVKLGRKLNESLWARGIRKPPARVKIVVEKNDEGVAWAELEGSKLPSELVVEEPKKDKKAAKAAPSKDEPSKE